MSTEYFFKGTFKGVHKCAFVDHCLEEDVDLDEISIPIVKVVHNTHDREAARIEKKSPFEFTAKNDREAARIGKKSPFEFTANKKIARSGTGKTIKVTSGNETQIHGELFPGFYSWWSLYPEDTILAKIEDEIDDLKTDELTVYVYTQLPRSPENVDIWKECICM